MTKANEPRKLPLTTRQASEYLGRLYAPATLESMRSRGGGPPFRRINGRVFYFPEDLDAWLAETRPLRSTAEYSSREG